MPVGKTSMIFREIFLSDERFQYIIHCKKNNEGMIDTSYIKAFAKWRQVGDFAGDLASRLQPLSTFLLGVKDGGCCFGKWTSGWSS